MNSGSKLLALGCAIAVTGCAQGGFGNAPGALGQGGSSMLPASGRAGAAAGRAHRNSGSSGPEIYVFGGTPDAYKPLTGLANVGNTLYGTTYQGGATNEGALYSVTTSGSESVMHSFPTGSNDGYYPQGPLTAANGTLYGTTYYGGANGEGVLFSITPSNSYQVLYNFGQTSSDCASPDTALEYVPSKKALYGVAYHGGTNGEGCIFKYSLGKNPGESVVYSLTGAPSSSTGASAPVFYKNALYVTTPGGGTKNHGAILKVTLAGSERLIYSFKNDPDGQSPEAPLVVMGNALYGTTQAGGQGACEGYAGCGTVFKVTPSGKETVIYRFKDNASIIDGQGPQAALIAVAGTLYGTTPSCTGNGCGAGTVFAMTPSGSETILFHFTVPPSNPSGFPQNPYSPVLSLNGTLYGTTDVSDRIGYGTVYAVAQ
ncbi:MAG: choice-of-anchor tandem repeat GloVer-containing protein [Candidatus Cybelea sp.]